MQKTCGVSCSHTTEAEGRAQQQALYTTKVLQASAGQADEAGRGQRSYSQVRSLQNVCPDCWIYYNANLIDGNTHKDKGTDIMYFLSENTNFIGCLIFYLVNLIARNRKVKTWKEPKFLCRTEYYRLRSTPWWYGKYWLLYILDYLTRNAEQFPLCSFCTQKITSPGLKTAKPMIYCSFSKCISNCQPLIVFYSGQLHIRGDHSNISNGAVG